MGSSKSGNNNDVLRSVSTSPLSSLDDDSDIFDDLGTSEDEYVPEGTKKKGKGGKARSPTKSKKPVGEARSTRSKSSRKTSSTDPGPQELTSRQMQDTLTAFALFFPELRGQGSNESVLVEKSLGIKDIANAASLIKEKLKAEEVHYFHSYASPTSLMVWF